MKLLYRIVGIIVLALAAATGASAQNFTTVTASSIGNAAGSNLANGTICFQATNTFDAPVSFSIGGIRQASFVPVCGAVSNGAITGEIVNGTATANPLLIANPSNTLPAGIVYRITVTDTDAGTAVITYKDAVISGATFNFDQYVANPNAYTVAGLSWNAAATVNLGTVSSVPYGTAPAVTNSGNSTQAVFNFQLETGPPGPAGPQGPAGTFTGTGATGGWLVPGTNTAGLSISKLPRVDVTHPDFGSSCSNAADPTGVNDSTCAVEAAATYASASAQRPGGAAPSIYFPHGIYKISGDPRIPCGLHIIGDGPNASIIEETNNSEGFTIIGQEFQPDEWDCMGSMEGIAFYTPNGHLYTATQLQLENTPGYTLRDIRVAGGGGRGIATLGSTERVKAYHIEIDTVRWPLLWMGNENHLWGLNIASPGFTESDNYHYGNNNAINGVVENYNWPGGTLISANGNGTTASFYIQGSNPTFKSTSPIVAGHSFQVSGTTGTVLDGMYVATSVTNNVTSDPSSICAAGNPCFEVQASSAASGTATVTSAAWKPAILPNRNAAVSVLGANWEIEGGSIKTLQDSGAFEVLSTFGSRLANFYCEGYSDSLDSCIVEGGLPPITTLTQALPASTSSTSVTVASNQWFHYFVNDSSDASSVVTSEVKIVPQDFLYGSTAASAFVPGVQRGQYEIALAEMVGNGTVYLGTRNVSGSTAPAGTAWPSGSQISEVPGPNLGTLEVAGNHYDAILPPGSNFASDCVDNSPLVCGEVIAGTIPNGVSTFTTGQAAGGAGQQAFMEFDGGDWFSGSTEAQGQGYIKARGKGAVITATASAPGSALGFNATNGQVANFVNVQEADSSYPYAIFSSPQMYYNSTGGFGTPNGAFAQLINQPNDAVAGPNPGMSSSLGRQYAASWCYYDTPPNGQTHSAHRTCFEGGPSNTGNGVQLFSDAIWNGSAWVNGFSTQADYNNASLMDTTTTGSSNSKEMSNPNFSAGYDVLWGDAASHRYKFNANNAGSEYFTGIVTPAPSGDYAKFAANGIDIVDGGPLALNLNICSFTGATFGDKIIAANTAAIAAGGGIIDATCIAGTTNQTTGTTAPIEIGSSTTRVILKLPAPGLLTVTQNGINLPTPAATSVSTTASGSGYAANTYYVKIAYYDGGHSAASSEMTATLSATGYLTVTSPPSVPYAYSYNVYASTTSGAETWQANCLIGQNCNIGNNYPNALLAGFEAAPTTANGTPAFIIHGASGSGIVSDASGTGFALPLASTANVSNEIATVDSPGQPTIKNVLLGTNTSTPGTVNDSVLLVQDAFNQSQISGIYEWCNYGSVPGMKIIQSNDITFGAIQIDGVGTNYCSPLMKLDNRLIYSDTSDSIHSLVFPSLLLANPPTSGVNLQIAGGLNGNASGIGGFAQDLVFVGPSFENNHGTTGTTSVLASDVRDLHLISPNFVGSSSTQTQLSFSESDACMTQDISIDDASVPSKGETFVSDGISPETISAPTGAYSTLRRGYHFGSAVGDSCPSAPTNYVRGMTTNYDAYSSPTGGGGGSTVASAEVVSFSATPTFSTTTNVSRIVLTGNITSFTLGAGSADGEDKKLCFEQGASPYTVTPPANVHGFFTVGATASTWSCQSFNYDATDSLWLANGPGVVNE